MPEIQLVHVLHFDQWVQVTIAIGTCGAAAATTCAVLFALRQSRLDTMVLLKVVVRVLPIDKVLGVGAHGEGAIQRLETLNVQIVNESRHPLSVGVVGWRTFRPFERQFMPQNFSGGNTLPIRLDRYEYATLWLTAPFDTWKHSFKEQLWKPWYFSRPYVRLEVRTTLNEKVFVRLPREVSKRLFG